MRRREGWKREVRVVRADRLAEMSSRMAAWGQPPVSIAWLGVLVVGGGEGVG